MKKYKCARCGREEGVVIDGKKVFCKECASLFGTCLTCVHSCKCEFDDNPAPIPKIVIHKERQQTAQGFIEQIQQVPNPQRIKTFCLEEKCICCDHADKPHCMRQFGTCDKYEEIEF